MKGGRRMSVNSINLNKVSHEATAAMISPIDTETKSIMNQITSQQQSLNRLSSDSELSAEEKAKERQEIQKQIAELNRKLRMLRMEKREETKKSEKEQEQKITAAEEENKKEVSRMEAEKSGAVEEIESQQEKSSISPQNIQKLLEAGTALQKERIQQNVEQEEKAVQNILEAEIKMDKLYGTDTSIKKEKLYSLIESGKKKVEIEEQPQKQSGILKDNPMKIVFRDDEII